MKRMKKRISIFLALTLLALLLTACGGNAAADNAGDMAAADMSMEAPMEMMEETKGEIAFDAAMADGGVNLIGSGLSGVRENAKVIRRANMSMQTKEYDSAVDALSALVTDMEGYFESRELYNRGAYRSGSFVVRVPVQSFDSFCTQVGQLCHLIHFSSSDEDISEQYYDTEARLVTQRTKLERLQELLSKAESMEDIITIESAISDTELQLEYLTGSLRKYDSLVDYGTIVISIDEVYRLSNEEEPVTTFGGRMSKAFTRGIENVVEGLEDFAVFLAYNWLVLLLVLLGGLTATVTVVRCRRKKKAQQKAAQTETKE